MNHIEKLVEQIQYHNNLYYNSDKPEISDVEYDNLVKELKALIPNHPVFNEIGNAVYGQKFEHKTVMGSLSKCHKPEEIVEKLGEHQLVLMPKIDGCSLSLHYKNGKLDKAVTRGDGYVGEIVTQNAKMIVGVPLTVAQKGDFEVRGEAYIPKADFYGIMDQPGYAGFERGLCNPRNAASGAIRHKDARMTSERQVHFVAYKLLGEGFSIFLSDNLACLSGLGFQDVPYWTRPYVANDIQDIIKRIKETKWEYDIDGVVAVIDDQHIVEELGYAGKCPKGAIAFKFETEKKRAVIKNIVWQTGRTGKITPVAEIEPTNICGSTVARISLHNITWMKELDIAIGDSVLFEKANEIIPQVVEVLERAKDRNNINYPVLCPVCSNQTLVKGAFTQCNNPLCPAQIIQHFRFVLEILGIKGMDISTIEKMIDAEIITDVPSIFDITAAKLIAKGFGATESANWTKAVQGVKATPSQILACLGIEGWGETMFDNLFSKSKVSGEVWLAALCEHGHPTNLLNWITSMGPVRESTLLKGLVDKYDLLNSLVTKITVKKEAVGSLSGKSFCVTGTLSKGRKEIQEMIKNAGGIIKDSVSKDLSYLVVGEDAGSKLAKADKLNIPVLLEVELMALLK